MIQSSIDNLHNLFKLKKLETVMCYESTDRTERGLTEIILLRKISLLKIFDFYHFLCYNGNVP